MLRPSRPRRRRSAAAAVEFALVMSLVMVPLMIGVWEMGRVIQVQQVVANAAREGARLAAQGMTINATGAPTQIYASLSPTANTGNLANVQAAVYQTMVGAGLTALTWNTTGNTANDDFTVAFQFLDAPTGATAGATDPYQGVKNQRFTVTVTLTQRGVNKVKWVNLGVVNPATISYTVEWRCLVDDPFTVNTTIPTW